MNWPNMGDRRCQRAPWGRSVSKEAFALEVINLCFTRPRENIARPLQIDALPPLQGLRGEQDPDRRAGSPFKNLKEPPPASQTCRSGR
jgi:hypothetical protein